MRKPALVIVSLALFAAQGPLEASGFPLLALDPTDFFSVAPCRVLDTRSPDGPLGGPALVAGADRDFPLSGVCGIPSDATAVSINIAVTGAAGAGNLRLHAGGTAVPLVATINFSAGQTRSNNAVVGLSPAGDLAAFVGGSAGSVHLILDVNGYFAPAATGNLVINEVDYDQPGTDTTEYVELYNPTAAAIPLANLALILVNGATMPALEYRRVLLDPAGTIPAGGYLVIATSAVTAQGSGVRYTPPIADWPTTDAVQNGSPDGMLLVDTATMTIIDRLSYEGSVVNATITGFGSVNLVEGSPATAADDAAPTRSMARIPNGTDSDNAATDWAAPTTLTPGIANVP